MNISISQNIAKASVICLFAIFVGCGDRDIATDTIRSVAALRTKLPVGSDSRDTSSLEALTAANVSKRLLVLIDGEPLMAPTITGPLAGGRVLIPCGNAELKGVLEGKFQSMIRPAPEAN